MNEKTNTPKKGGKPHIAKLNEAAAIANIKAKLRVLRAIAESKDEPAVKIVQRTLGNSCGELNVDLPTTLRQFNRWTADAGAMGHFGIAERLNGNSQDTVRRNPKLRADIESTLKLLIDLRNGLASAESVSDSKLRRQLKVANNKIEILEKELLLQETRINAAFHARDIAELNVNQIKTDFHDEIRKRDYQIAALIKRHAVENKIVQFPQKHEGKKK